MAKHERFTIPTFALEDDAVLIVPNAKDLDVQAVGEALTRTARAHGGQLIAADVHEEAKDPRHPMHSHLEWDNEKAGYQWRLTQVRAIIRIVRVETGPAELRRAFINARADDGQSYRTLKDVISSKSLQERILEQAESDLAAWQHRYAELKDICTIVETALVELRKRKRGKTTPPESPEA